MNNDAVAVKTALTTSWVKLLFSITWVLYLTGCGFQVIKPVNLAGRISQVIVYSDNRYSDFNQELTKGLKESGVASVSNEISEKTNHDDSDKSLVVIDVIKDSSGQNVLSVSATNTPTEFEVFYTVQIRARVGSTQILAPTEFTLRREYSYTVDAALAKQHERDTIRAVMAHDISELVLRRLAALSW